MRPQSVDRLQNPLLTPVVLLRVEGLALLIAAVAIYSQQGGSWWLFALLLFTPDLAMLGYLAGPHAGAAVYNMVHTSALPILLALIAWFTGGTVLLLVSLIWLAHIGLDRLVGYGLKLPTGFSDTHLGQIGRRKTP